jgi:hypothetical protein
MTRFKCHQCGKESLKTGRCQDCNIAFEKACGVCGYTFDQCVCAGGSTKEPRAKH